MSKTVKIAMIGTGDISGIYLRTSRRPSTRSS